MVAVTGGNLSQALRAGFIAMATAAAFNFVGNVTGHQPDFGTPEYAANVAGHAAVGCVSAAASGGKCGAGALSAAVGAAGAPLIRDSGLGLIGGTAASAALGGLGSVAAGGKFADGAVTAAFGYLFNSLGGDSKSKPEPSGQQEAYCAPCVTVGAQLAVDAFAVGVGLYNALYGPEATYHGNDLRSQRPTYVYEIYGPDVREGGSLNVLKYGITSAGNPQDRYTENYYKQYGLLLPLEWYPTRQAARYQEYGLCMSFVQVNGRVPTLSGKC